MGQQRWPTYKLTEKAAVKLTKLINFSVFQFFHYTSCAAALSSRISFSYCLIERCLIFFLWHDIWKYCQLHSNFEWKVLISTSSLAGKFNPVEYKAVLILYCVSVNLKFNHRVNNTDWNSIEHWWWLNETSGCKMDVKWKCWCIDTNYVCSLITCLFLPRK